MDWKNIDGYFRRPAMDGLDRKSLGAVAGASIAINLLLFAIPLYSLQIYDRVLTSRSPETLVYLTLIVAFAVVATAACDAIRSRLLLRISNSYALRIALPLMEAAVAKSAKLAEPDGHAAQDLTTIRSFISSPQGLVVLFDAPLSPIFLLMVFLIHTGLGLAMLLGMAVQIILAFITDAQMSWRVRSSVQSSSLAQQRMEASLRNAEVIEAMGMYGAVRRYWGLQHEKALAESSRVSDASTMLISVSRLFRNSFGLAMMALGAWYALADQLTIGGMVACNILTARGMAPLEMLISAWKRLLGAGAAAERMNRTLEDFSRPQNRMSLPVPDGDLEVERLIYFPPGADQPILKGVSFVLPKGKWLGVVGPSASGKSTLMKLICGAWRPRSGSVRLDSAEVSAWARDDFGRHCGYLPQDIELFAGSVRDNIARFTDCDDTQIVDAAKKAGVHEMILHLPQGYETEVGPNGAYLSAGQRQRVALARALIGNPKLIVLDEPNSNLDTEGEQALVRAVMEARTNGATIVMVCHRPSLLAEADLIAVVIDGQIQRMGPRDEILAAVGPAALSRQGAREAWRVAS